jgi:hypothetical protein
MAGVAKMIKGTEIESVWYDEINNTEFNKRYNWCLENLGPARDSPPRWWPVDLGRGSFRFRDPADQRRVMAQQAVEQLAAKK